jgi:hypothetical protein
VAVLSPRTDNRAVFYSASFDEEVSFEIASMGVTPEGRWSDYPAGVLWSLRQERFESGGFNMSLTGDVPLGAGLSSSASLEVAAAMAFAGKREGNASVEDVSDAVPKGGERVCRSKERNHGSVCRRMSGREPGNASRLQIIGVRVAAIACRSTCGDLQFDGEACGSDGRVWQPAR